MKKQNKRILSLLMALCLTLALIPAAFAEDTAATITAFNASGAQVGTTYTTIDAAVNAAGEGGKVTISAGVLAVNGRQSIGVAGVTVEGAGRDQTFIKPSASFASASETNRKALLTIAANNVTVKGMSIDGTAYGSTLNMNSFFSFKDFVILRINAGTGVELNDVYLTGSPKTLLQVGTSSTSATVTAYDLVCQAEPKSISQMRTYADIDITQDSSLTVNSGATHGFIGTDGAYTITGASEPVFAVTHGGISPVTMTSTFQHFAETYVALRSEASSLVKRYANDFSDSTNQSSVAGMVARAKEVASTQSQAVQNLITLLGDAKNAASGDIAAVLQGYIDELNAALNVQG